MRSSESSPRILDIGTAVPPHRCTRRETLEFARQVLAGDPRTIAFVERVLEGSQIDCRHTVVEDYGLPLEERTFFSRSPDGRPLPGTAKRNQIFEREAPVLALAACRAMSPAPWQAQVTHLVTASCTGFSAPGFDVTLARSLGLSPRVQRTHVGFMGCFAGFSTLRLARQICAADPSALVLIVHVELCSLHIRLDSDPEVLVANCIFSDGAAAALVGASRQDGFGQHPPLALLGDGSFLLPEGESDMTWSIGDHGFRMTLSPRVPHLLSKHLPTAFATLLQEYGVPRDSIRHWAIHPGGAAIVRHAERALGLASGELTLARDLLRSHGNMSSATLWFLLDRIRREPVPGVVYGCGFGPGLTLESALLSKAT
jgi:predicted naringenin-chalcone synthase